MPLNWRKLELKILWTDNLWNRWTKLEKLYNLNPVQRSPNPLSHAVDAVRLCSTRGSFCGAVLGQLAQIPSQQRSASSLSHAVDRGSPVLHTREFLRSGPWAVSSNSQQTVLGQYLVTCRRPRLACAPHEGDFLNSLEEDHLPIYVVHSQGTLPSHWLNSVVTWERLPLDRLLIDPRLFFSLDCPCEGQAMSRQWWLCC